MMLCSNAEKMVECLQEVELVVFEEEEEEEWEEDEEW
jgi:hypothetical protein